MDECSGSLVMHNQQFQIKFSLQANWSAFSLKTQFAGIFTSSSFAVKPSSLMDFARKF